MDVAAVIGRVRQAASVRADVGAGRDALEAGLRSIGVVRSWLAASEADLAARLAAVVSFPEKSIADAGRATLGEAGRVLERSVTLGTAPALAAGLNDGSVTAGHIDAVTKVANGLEGSQRDELLARANAMAGAAGVESVVEFRRRLERAAKSLRADDGMGRFERQKSAARLRRWTDRDGMWCLQGRFDPVTGVRINARLTAEIEGLFAESVPEGCPTDPVAKQEFLAAWALARIIEAAGSRSALGDPSSSWSSKPTTSPVSPTAVQLNRPATVRRPTPLRRSWRSDGRLGAAGRGAAPGAGRTVRRRRAASGRGAQRCRTRPVS